MGGLSVTPVVDKNQNQDGGWRTNSPTILSKTSFLCNSPEMSDIKFIFKGKDKTKETVIYGHKFILAMGSPVFHKMFYTQNQQFVTTVKETLDMKDYSFTADAFLAFMKFLYTDKINYEKHAYKGQPMEFLFGIMSCANYYDVPLLKKDCVKQFEKITDKTNVIPILEAAMSLKELDLAEKASEFIDRNLKVVLEKKESLRFKRETLFEILKRDSLGIDESFVLDFALKWAERKCKSESLEANPKNKRNVLGQVFFEIRFGLLTSTKISELVSLGYLMPLESTDILLEVHSGGSKFQKMAPDVAFKSNPRIVDQKAKLTETANASGKNGDSEYLKLRSLATAKACLRMTGFKKNKTEAKLVQDITRKTSLIDLQVRKLNGNLGGFIVEFRYNPREETVYDFTRIYGKYFGFDSYPTISVEDWSRD